MSRDPPLTHPYPTPAVWPQGEEREGKYTVTLGRGLQMWENRLNGLRSAGGEAMRAVLCGDTPPRKNGS